MQIVYAAVDLRTLAHLLRGQRDGDQLVRDFLATAYTVVRRILDVEVVLDSDSTAPELIPRDDPVIVRCRATADPATACWWRGDGLSGYSLRVRVVLKAVLRCVLVLHFAGNLGCLCFLAQATVPVSRFTIWPR